MRKCALPVLLLASLCGTALSQTCAPGSYRLGMPKAERPQGENGSPGLRSNSVNDILISGGVVWVATGGGLSRSTDSGATWETFTQSEGLGKGGISAIAIHDGTIWVATAFDTLTELGTYGAGGGISFSTDNGVTWTWFPQPVDSPDETKYKPTTTNVQNITYDIAVTDEHAVWIASYGGGLRRSTDNGATWEVVTVDGIPFDALGYLTHRAFSVLYDGHALWAGTAGGVHRSLDGGATWTTFSHQNQEEPISGNFVVAIASQPLAGSNRIWAATIEALDVGEIRAVSFSDDMGLTWTTTLEGEFTHNFGIDAGTDAVYAVSDNGAFRSADGGSNWAAFPLIRDETSGECLATSVFTAAGIVPFQSIWLGSTDGLAASTNDGVSWTIFRSFPKPGTDGTPETYAYPNPFSPERHNVTGGEGHVRFQYSLRNAASVTVKVYDFGMNLVRTVTEGKERPAAGDYSELWDGRNDLGDIVANGVYFYRISVDGGTPLWGKVMVVN